MVLKSLVYRMKPLLTIPSFQKKNSLTLIPGVNLRDILGLSSLKNLWDFNPKQIKFTLLLFKYTVFQANLI